MNHGLGLAVSLVYIEDDIICNYESENGKYKGPIKREELLKMDYTSFTNFMEKKSREQFYDNVSEVSKEYNEFKLFSRDIVNLSKELLVEGSGGSIICDNVEKEMKKDILEKENSTLKRNDDLYDEK